MGAPVRCPVTARDLERFGGEVQKVHAIRKASMNDDYELADQLRLIKWSEFSYGSDEVTK